MSDPNANIVAMLTDILTEYQKHGKDLPLVCAFIAPDGEVWTVYNECGYTDLRRVADAIDDEATLRMLAANQDSLQKFVDEIDSMSEDDNK